MRIVGRTLWQHFFFELGDQLGWNKESKKMYSIRNLGTVIRDTQRWHPSNVAKKLNFLSSQKLHLHLPGSRLAKTNIFFLEGVDNSW